jgi:hypothetical protein
MMMSSRSSSRVTEGVTHALDYQPVYASFRDFAMDTLLDHDEENILSFFQYLLAHYFGGGTEWVRRELYGTIDCCNFIKEHHVCIERLISEFDIVTRYYAPKLLPDHINPTRVSVENRGTIIFVHHVSPTLTLPTHPFTR